MFICGGGGWAILHKQHLHIDKFIILYWQVNECTTDDELVRLFQAEEMLDPLLEANYSKPVTHLTLSDRNEINQTLADFHCYMKRKACMDQFMEGLDAVGVARFVRSYPALMEPLFFKGCSTPLNPGKILFLSM